jgi:hypothetical protein
MAFDLFSSLWHHFLSQTPNRSYVNLLIKIQEFKTLFGSSAGKEGESFEYKGRKKRKGKRESPTLHESLIFFIRLKSPNGGTKKMHWGENFGEF